MKTASDLADDIGACIVRNTTIHILADELVRTIPRTANAIAQSADDIDTHLREVLDGLQALSKAERNKSCSKFEEHVPTVEELSLPDLLAAGIALLPIAEALSAARNRRDLSDAVVGFLLPLRETVDDALHGIIERVEKARPTSLGDACNRSRLLLANMAYRDEATSYIAETAMQLARDEACAR